MSEYDIHNNIGDEVAFETTEITQNGTNPGKIINTAGFESIEFIILSFLVAGGGTFTILLEEDDDALMPVETRTVVSADDTLGVLPVFVDADDNTTKRVGSIGKKQYQRLSIVSDMTGGTTTLSAIAILGNPHTSPVPQ